MNEEPRYMRCYLHPLMVIAAIRGEPMMKLNLPEGTEIVQCPMMPDPARFGYPILLWNANWPFLDPGDTIPVIDCCEVIEEKRDE